MSEVQKPVGEPVVASTTETPAVEPVAETKPVEEAAAAPAETATETPLVTEIAPATEEAAAPTKEEPKPIEEGVLGYKGPGLIKSFIFQKKLFWFGSEAVESRHLASYLRGEKSQEVANHNAAWSSHTGKGLLFFSKKDSEKTSPAGVINLSEASDVTNDGAVDFFFTVNGHKNTFQGANLVERDSWVSTLKTKIAEAKEMKDSVTGSDTYKNTHSSLSKPVVAAAALPKKSTEVKKEEKAEAKEEKAEAKEEKKEEKKEIKEEKKEEKAEAKEEKKARKSRSASRKRNSIFGSIGFGKKEDKVEPKEETPVAAAAAPEETAAAPVETAPVETPALAAEATPAVAPVEEAKAAETKPAPTKRNSIFGSLQSKFAPKEKKPEEAAPAVPAKDAEPVSETAPVIPAVEATEPLATSVASPATVPTETTAVPTTNGETKAAEAPVIKSDKRKSSLPWLNKKEKATTSDEEAEKAEKPLSPFAKLRATVKGKTSPKAAEKPAEEVAEPAPEAPAAAEPAVPAATEPVVSEPVSAAHTSTPQVSATA